MKFWPFEFGLLRIRPYDFQPFVVKSKKTCFQIKIGFFVKFIKLSADNFGILSVVVVHSTPTAYMSLCRVLESLLKIPFFNQSYLNMVGFLCSRLFLGRLATQIATNARCDPRLWKVIHFKYICLEILKYYVLETLYLHQTFANCVLC